MKSITSTSFPTSHYKTVLNTLDFFIKISHFKRVQKDIFEVLIDELIVKKSCRIAGHNFRSTRANKQCIQNCDPRQDETF